MEEIDNKAEKRKDADIMKKYKAVFSDIDGTLLNSKHQIPENTRKKIKQINQNGIPYVLVSARMPKGMTAISRIRGEESNDLLQRSFSC
mgnify:CR=1 FL=1